MTWWEYFGFPDPDTRFFRYQVVQPLKSRLEKGLVCQTLAFCYNPFILTWNANNSQNKYTLFLVKGVTEFWLISKKSRHILGETKICHRWHISLKAIRKNSLKLRIKISQRYPLSREGSEPYWTLLALDSVLWFKLIFDDVIKPLATQNRVVRAYDTVQ